MPYYEVTKTYGHERGLSCAFRQWRATSHCRKLHGYSLSVEITLGSQKLDVRNWVYDFGGFKFAEEWLRKFFDHTTVIAEDDPLLEAFSKLDEAQGIDLCVLPNIGCEAFAEFIARMVPLNLPDGVSLVKVKIAEHGSNSATYYPGR